MKVDATIAELRTRLSFAHGTPSLLLVVCPGDAEIEETHRLLREILLATPMQLVDLGTSRSDVGPAGWAELTRASPGDAFLLTLPTPAQLTLVAFARRLNAERQLLRDLAGPVALLVSRRSEQAIRKHAQDFFTWIAAGYELADLRELREYAASLGLAHDKLAPAAPREQPIRFLHLSDLHLRPPPTKRFDQDRVLDGLLALLERDRPTFPLDLLFVTGDLAQSARPDEYALITGLLTRLMATTGVTPHRVFTVPGNHDVDRGVGRWLLRTLAGDDDAVAFFVEPASRTFHEHKLAAYAASMRALLGDPRPLGLRVGADAVEIVELKGARVAIASFNSAWFAQGDDDQGKLWLGEPNVRGALERIADAEAQFAVALFHHPFEDLHPEDRERVEPLFERGFDLVLRGHLHTTRSRSLASQRGGYVEQAAPAAYQGSKWPNGCFLGEIRPRARTVRLRPYTFAAGADPWVLDTSVFPDDEQDGYCHTFTVPPKQRMKTSRSRALRAAAVEAIKTASPEQRQELLEQTTLDVDATARRSDAVAADELVAASPGAMRNLLGPHNRGLEALAAIEWITSLPPEPTPRITITSRESLRDGLLRAGRLFLQAATRHRLPEKMTLMVLSAALEKMIDAAITIEEGISVDSRILRPDILIRDRMGAPLCIVQVMKHRALRGTSEQNRQDGVHQVEDYRTKTGSKHGALIILSSPPAREPQFDDMNGSEVSVLRL